MNSQPKTENAEGKPSLEPAAASTQTEKQTVIPVIAEELVVDAKPVRTNAVRVHKRVRERIEHIDIPVVQDTVDIRRVAIDRVVESPPPVRKEGSTIIVPVVQEEIVVTKRLVLKEEVHLIRRRARTRASRDVAVRREEAEVERVDAEAHAVPGRVTQEPPYPNVRRRNKIIPED